MKLPATTLTRQAMAGGDAVDLVFDRAGVGVDIDAGGGFKNDVIGWDLSWERGGCFRLHAWYPIGSRIASETADRNALATDICSAYD